MIVFVKFFLDQNFEDCFPKFSPKKSVIFPFPQIFIIKHTFIMDIQQYILNNTGVLLPISGGNGQSQDQAVVIDSNAKYRLIQVENEFISSMLDNGYWKKVEQSLKIQDDRKYDNITINNFFDDGEVVERVFWFDITECFGI